MDRATVSGSVGRGFKSPQALFLFQLVRSLSASIGTAYGCFLGCLHAVEDIHPCSQVIGSKMSIPSRHVAISVPEQSLDYVQINSVLHEPTCKGMSQIMEPEILYCSLFTCIPEPFAYLRVVNADWSAPQIGDVLVDENFDHEMIFESFVNNGTSVKVIQASYGELEVIESTWSLTWFQSHYYVYRFKTDSTNPTINFLGVQDGGVYDTAVTVTIFADDDTSEPNSGLYFYGDDGEGKFKQKQFTDGGEYTITADAQDWVKNPIFCLT